MRALLWVAIGFTMALSGCGDEDGGGGGWPCSISSSEGTWTYEVEQLPGDSAFIRASHTDGSEVLMQCAVDCSDGTCAPRCDTGRVALASGEWVNYVSAYPSAVASPSDVNVLAAGPEPRAILPVHGVPGEVVIRTSGGGPDEIVAYEEPAPCEDCTITYGCAP